VSRLKTWFRDFKGVSMKCLQNRVNLLVAIKKQRNRMLPLRALSGQGSAGRAIFLPDFKDDLINILLYLHLK
jgi:hypothetical protein